MQPHTFARTATRSANAELTTLRGCCLQRRLADVPHVPTAPGLLGSNAAAVWLAGGLRKAVTYPKSALIAELNANEPRRPTYAEVARRSPGQGGTAAQRGTPGFQTPEARGAAVNQTNDTNGDLYIDINMLLNAVRTPELIAISQDTSDGGAPECTSPPTPLDSPIDVRSLDALLTERAQRWATTELEPQRGDAGHERPAPEQPKLAPSEPLPRAYDADDERDEADHPLARRKAARRPRSPIRVNLRGGAGTADAPAEPTSERPASPTPPSAREDAHHADTARETIAADPASPLQKLTLELRLAGGAGAATPRSTRRSAAALTTKARDDQPPAPTPTGEIETPPEIEDAPSSPSSSEALLEEDLVTAEPPKGPETVAAKIFSFESSSATTAPSIEKVAALPTTTASPFEAAAIKAAATRKEAAEALFPPAHPRHFGLPPELMPAPQGCNTALPFPAFDGRIHGNTLFDNDLEPGKDRSREPAGALLHGLTDSELPSGLVEINNVLATTDAGLYAHVGRRQERMNSLQKELTALNDAAPGWLANLMAKGLAGLPKPVRPGIKAAIECAHLLEDLLRAPAPKPLTPLLSRQPAGHTSCGDSVHQLLGTGRHAPALGEAPRPAVAAAACSQNDSFPPPAPPKCDTCGTTSGAFATEHGRGACLPCELAQMGMAPRIEGTFGGVQLPTPVTSTAQMLPAQPMSAQQTLIYHTGRQSESASNGSFPGTVLLNLYNSEQQTGFFAKAMTVDPQELPASLAAQEADVARVAFSTGIQPHHQGAHHPLHRHRAFATHRPPRAAARTRMPTRTTCPPNGDGPPTVRQASS